MEDHNKGVVAADADDAADTNDDDDVEAKAPTWADAIMRRLTNNLVATNMVRVLTAF